MMKYKIVRLCQHEAMSVVPQMPASFDLEKVAPVLKRAGYSVDDQGLMLIAVKDGSDITLYKSGRLLVHPVRTKEETTTLADAFYQAIEGVADSRSGTL